VFEIGTRDTLSAENRRRAVLDKAVPAKKAAGAADSNAVDAYLKSVPEPGRSTLEKVRAAIRSAIPAEASEAIGYGMPTFRYKGSGLVAYAAFKDHCSFFPMSLAVIAAFDEELKGMKASKGTIHFPLDKPLPAALLKKIVKARVAEKDAKKPSR
jgi:uncharacterized protein YdhG (YjbR/CyaY superfamily)